MKIGIVEVILWTFGVRLAFAIVLLLAVGVLPSLKDDLVTQAAILSAVHFGACALFAGRRPGRTWSETFATRRASGWILALALVLGVVASFPAGALAGWIERLFPLPEADRLAYEVLLKPRSFAHAVALFVFAAGIGPLGEELLFRGALYTGLRPHHGAAYAGLATGVFFTISHPELRFWPSILAMAGILAAMRAVSGSLWPAFFMHAGFNATDVAMSVFPKYVKEPSLPVVVACVPGSAAILGIILWIGRRSVIAERARHVDLAPAPGLGETES